MDHTDGLRLTSEDGEIIHLRPSGNAPELRCYCEAASPIRARQLVASTMRHLLSVKG
jgi:phosphomannomutase